MAPISANSAFCLVKREFERNWLRERDFDYCPEMQRTFRDLWTHTIDRAAETPAPPFCPSGPTAGAFDLLT
jgi:hypothetical protein